MAALDPDLGDPAARGPSDLLVTGVIALGGAVGSLARWGLAEALPPSAGAVPWATLCANVSGSLLLGLLLGVLAVRHRAHPLLRPALGTGLLGGYTTFSTWTSESRALLAAGHLGAIGLYVVLTLALGLVAALLGLRLGRRLGGGLGGGPGRGPGRPGGADR